MPEKTDELLLALVLQQAVDPVRQLAGFLLTQDPGYLPPGAARAASRGVCREDLLKRMLAAYLENL